MNRSLITLVFGFMVLFSQPSFAQDAQSVNKLLTDSATSFRQDNYFLGVSQVSQACAMLRRNPSAGSESYLELAGSCLDAVNKSISDAQARGDTQTVTRRVYALQPLIQSLLEWDPQNPRWHFEKGMLFKTQSISMNDRFPAILEQAVGEFKKALAISGGGSFRANAESQLAACQQTIQRRNGEIATFERNRPRRNSPSTESVTPVQTPPAQTYCPKCGGSHAYGACPYTHGG